MGLDPRFIIASDLQSYFVDKDTGTPLAAGIVTFYEDDSRTTLKNIYKLSGTPPNYTYTALTNPVTLSSVGTFQDPDTGDDIVPYYFPYEGTPEASNGDVELYYITVESSGHVSQFTREAWPNFTTQTQQSEDLTNYVSNGQFLAHNDVPESDTTDFGEITQPITNIAQGGWTFERPNSSTAVDIVTFHAFGSYVANPSASPKFYVQVNTQNPSAGDSYKDLRLKFSDVNKFASTTQQYTFSFSAESNTGSNLSVQLILIKNFGTGGSATTETPIANLTITNTYTIINASFVFGINTGKTIGTAGDDFLQLAVRFPVDSVFDVSLTNFVLTSGALVLTGFPQTPDYLFRSQGIAGFMPTPAADGSDLYLPLRLTASGLEYDHSQIGKIIATLAPIGIGQLECDGAQYETDGYSSDGIPYSRLQKVLFDTNTNMPIAGTGNAYVSAYPVSSVSNAMILICNDIGLTSVVADGAITTGFTFSTIKLGTTAYDFNGRVLSPRRNIYIQCQTRGTVASPGSGTSGFTVTSYRNNDFLKSLTAVTTTAATSLASKYFLVSTPSINYYVWFKVDGTGTDPAIGGATGIEIDLLSTDSDLDVGLIVANALDASQLSRIVFTAGNTITGGSYFNFYTVSLAFYVWYTVDGTGTDPDIINKTGIKVAVLSTDTATQVFTKTQLAINRKYFRTPALEGVFLRGWNNGGGIDPDALNRWSDSSLNVGDSLATYQFDEVIEHHHLYVQGGEGDLHYAAGGAYKEINISNQNTDNYGGNEDRPYNFYVKYLINY